MKKSIKIFILPLVLGLPTTLTGCAKKQESNSVYEQVKASRTITWGVKADTRLFGLISVKTGRIEGFEVDLAKALTERMLGKNAEAEFMQTTPRTRIPLLKDDNIDAILATMTTTPGRKKQVTFNGPHFTAGQSLLVKDSSTIKNVKDLNDKVALAIKETTTVDNAKKFTPKTKVLECDDYGQAFTALKAGQGQVMTTDNGLLAGITSESKGYKLTGGTYTSEPYGIAVEEGQAGFADRISRALNELKEDGIYHHLLVEWFNGIPGFNIKEVENS